MGKSRKQLLQERREILKGLSDKEREVWDFVLGYLADHDSVPSYRVICEKFEWTSLRSAKIYVDKLEAKGLFRDVARTEFRGYQVITV